MDNTVDEGGDKFQGGQFDTGYGTHDGRGNVNTHSREQPGTLRIRDLPKCMLKSAYSDLARF